MAWTRTADAITATFWDTDDVDGWTEVGTVVVSLTSTSTIRVLEPARGWYDSRPSHVEVSFSERADMANTRRLMFGVDWSMVSAAVEGELGKGFGAESQQKEPFDADPGVVEEWAASYSGSTRVLRWLTWIQTENLDGTFAIANAEAADLDSVKPFYETRVPTLREAQLEAGATFDYVHLSYATGAPERVAEDASKTTVSLVYKDPFVVYVGVTDAAGWWMLVSRYRTDPAGNDVPDTNPDMALGDLVAFWAPTEDPEFRTDQVKGPFRLVGSTACVTDSAGVPLQDLRLWIGTSGAAVVTPEMSGDGEGHLYVYYVVEVGQAMLADPDTDKAAIGESMDTYGVVEGVWLKKIPLSVLAQALDHADTQTDEATWSDLPLDPVVPGTIVGRVRVWTVEDWAKGGSAADIESAYLDRNGDGVFFADPSPVVQDGVLALFLAAIVPDALGESGFDGEGPTPYLGVWSCVAVDASAVTTVYGLEFTVRYDASGAGADDHVASTGTDTSLYLDPDPVAPLGARTNWQVYVGQDSGSLPLGIYETDESEVFRAWDVP